jgi:predicted metalloendopeptidase
MIDFKTRNIANYIGSIVTNLIELTTQKAIDLLKQNQYKILNEFCLSISSNLFPNLIGRLYIDKLFDKESMGDMKSLVNDLKQAFNELLNENNWMDPKTKANAMSKLKAMAVNIASPDSTFNDNELELYSNQVRLFIKHMVIISKNEFFFSVQRFR